MIQQSHCWAYTLKKPERDTCTPMFIAALFIIARTWKQPRWPSADEWIRKLWYIYTMEYHSAIKKNTFESVLMRLMKLEPIIIFISIYFIYIYLDSYMNLHRKLPWVSSLTRCMHFE